MEKKQELPLAFMMTIGSIIAVVALVAGNNTWINFRKILPRKEPGSDLMLATVNRVSIYHSAIDRCKIQQELIADDSKIGYTDEQWLENQIRIQIMIMEAQRLGIACSGSELDERIKEQKDNYYKLLNDAAGSAVVGQINAACEAEGVTPEVFFAQYAREYYQPTFDFMKMCQYVYDIDKSGDDFQTKINRYIDSLLEQGTYKIAYYNNK